MRRLYALVLPLLVMGAPACVSADSEENDGAGAALSEGEGFAKKITKLTTLRDSRDGGLGLPSWRPFVVHPQVQTEPLLNGCTNGGCLSLIDVERLKLRDVSGFDIAVDDLGASKAPRLGLSTDGRWMAFQRSAADGSVFVVEVGDDPAAAFKIEGKPDRPPTFAWVGQHTLLLKTAGNVRAFDVKTRAERFSIDVGSGEPTNMVVPESVATPAADHVLVYTAFEAKLARVIDGTTTPVADWNVIPSIEAKAPSRTTNQMPAITISPSGNGFAVVRESVDNIHRSVAFLGLDGKLAILHPAARPDVAFAADGALAYVRPVDGAAPDPFGAEDCSVVVHRMKGDDVVLDKATAYERGLRFSPDGTRIVAGNGRFLGRSDSSGALEQLDLGDATNGVGQVSFSSSFDQAFVQTFKKGVGDQPSPLPGRLFRLDLAKKTSTPLIGIKELPNRWAGSDWFWMTAEPDVAEPTVYTRAAFHRRLVTPKGQVLCMLPFQMAQELGWSEGVFYFLTDVRGEGQAQKVQLHGVSRDCKVHAIIGGTADEMVVQTAPDRSDGFQENKLVRALFRIDRDVFAFTPSEYKAPAVPATPPSPENKGSEGSEEVPSAPPPVVSSAAPASDPETEDDEPGTTAPTKKPKAGGCAASPASTSPTGALTIMALALLALSRRARRKAS